MSATAIALELRERVRALHLTYAIVLVAIAVVIGGAGLIGARYLARQSRTLAGVRAELRAAQGAEALARVAAVLAGTKLHDATVRESADSVSIDALRARARRRVVLVPLDIPAAIAPPDGTSVVPRPATVVPMVPVEVVDATTFDSLATVCTLATHDCASVKQHALEQHIADSTALASADRATAAALKLAPTWRDRAAAALKWGAIGALAGWLLHR